MENKSEKYQLCVLEGVQQGSRQGLRMAQTHTVGNSFECDIYLHDDCETENQIEILPGRFSISITLVSGDAVLDSEPMLVGKKYKLSSGVPVRLGDNLFTVSTTEAMSTESNMPVVNPEFDTGDSNDQLQHVSPFDETESEEAVYANTGLVARLYRPGFLVFLIGVGIIGSVFAAWRSGPIKVAEATALAEQSQLSVVQDQAAPAIEDIENSVIDVFRTYGVSVEASSISEGVVKVTTTSTDTSKLAAAEASANADVYGLKKLIVDYNQPEPETVTPQKKVVSKAADQEIRMIVIGNPTYVVANNQSRYFKGSKLPTGHRVADIKKGLVVVEKNGVTTELKL